MVECIMDRGRRNKIPALSQQRVAQSFVYCAFSRRLNDTNRVCKASAYKAFLSPYENKTLNFTLTPAGNYNNEVTTAYETAVFANVDAKRDAIVHVSWPIAVSPFCNLCRRFLRRDYIIK